MTWRDTVDSFYSEEIEAFYEQGLDKALDEAQTKGWTVVDMKNDWLTVFPSDGDTKP